MGTAPDVSTLVHRGKALPRGVGTRSPVRRREVLAAYGFAAPFFVLFLVFTVGPVLASFGMSFTDLTSKDVRKPLAVEPVGLDNYTKLLQTRRSTKRRSTRLLRGHRRAAGDGAGARRRGGLNSGITRFRTLFRVGYYLPVVTSIVAIAVVWRFLLATGQRHRQHAARLRRHRRAVVGQLGGTDDSLRQLGSKRGPYSGRHFSNGFSGA